MRISIPFFSKRTKKVLEDNKDRIFLMTKEQQDSILADKNIKLDDKLKQLLKENNELKVLFDELQEQLSKDLKGGGNYVFEISKASIEIIPDVKVLPDSQLKYRNKTVDIDEPERVGRLKAMYRTRQFRVWFVEPEGEYTFDPRDKTPIEIKKKSEETIKIKNEITKASFIQNILKGLAGIKKWYDYIPWIVFGATISIIIIAVFWWLGGYTLTKVA